MKPRIAELRPHPVTVDEMLEHARTHGFTGSGSLVGFYPDQFIAVLSEIQSLRARIDSLERAQGLTPGTSMHTNWKEGTE